MICRHCFLYLLCLSYFSSYAQTPSYQLAVDSTTHQYSIRSSYKLVAQPTQLVDDGITIGIVQNSIKPQSAIDITVHFPDPVDLSLVDFLVFTVFRDCPSPCSEYVSESYVSSKLVDFATRTVKFTVDGLLPGSPYKLRTIIWGLDGAPCGSDHLYNNYFTTAPEAGDGTKRLLLVVNNEWQNNQAVQQALDQYIHDLGIRGPKVLVDTYYIGTTNAEKITLYDSIKARYMNEGLDYLFFIGRNAAVPVAIILLNTQGAEIGHSPQLSFAWYTQPWYKAYEYNGNRQEFISPKYKDVCYRGENEVRNKVFQQSASAISMGMFIPTPYQDAQLRTNEVLAYFNKLHRYKNYEFEFERKVLSSDGMHNEQSTIQQASSNGRWNGVDTVRVGRVKDYNYSGLDQVWKDDYKQKLENNSYEILNYNGHGAYYYHSFGFYESDVLGLSPLNTQIINFHSCNVGNFRYVGYLANRYLSRGNVLAVHAYSDLVIEFVNGGISPLAREFSQYGIFDYLSKGYTISDAFRYSHGYIDTELILGDPLLTLRETCGPVIESQNSGNWHTPTTWTCGRVPTKNDAVRILSAHTVRLGAKGEVRDISIEGTLDLLPTGELEY